jgi:para-nitrobenzyl esterase
MRRRSRALTGLWLVSIVMGITSWSQTDPLLVKTAQGRVHGKTIHNGRVRAFLGLPYAAPPVGDLRWRPPARPARWRGTREATRYGARCMQEPHEFPDMVFQDAGPSEDCLYLNVFTPADAGEGKRLPVMFWIHGGGFRGGSASEPRHNGDYLPMRGVVLVTINYRLGVFGFLATPDLAREQGGSTGNYGLLDTVAALEWVKANIAAFGGDPKNVTIFGESAGSEAVSALMAAAPARGLFQKAIGESGGALDIGGPARPSFQRTLQQDQAWVNSLGLSLDHLRDLPAEEVLAASKRSDAPAFRPVVDGRLLTEPVAVTFAAGRQAHVPLLAGWNRDEQHGLGAGMTAEKWREFARRNFGSQADEFLKFFPAGTDDQAVRSAIDYNSDDFIAFGTWRWVNAQVKSGQSPVYRYHFELPAPPSTWHPGSYAFHSDDIEYVFGTLDTRPGAAWRPEDRKLSTEIQWYWTNFARTGNPNGAGLPNWPRFDTTGEVLHLGNPIHADPDTTRARYEFLAQWLPRNRPR